MANSLKEDVYLYTVKRIHRIVSSKKLTQEFKLREIKNLGIVIKPYTLYIPDDVKATLVEHAINS